MRLSRFFLFVFTVSSIIVCFLFLKRADFIETSEDSFHKSVHANHNTLDDSPILKFDFRDKNSYQVIKDNVYQNDIFHKHDERIHKFRPNFTLNKEEILSDKSNILNLNFSDDACTCIMIFNHYYLGGESFLRLKSDAFYQKPNAIPHNSLFSLLLLPRFAYDYRSFITSDAFQPLPRSVKIRRYYEDKIFSLDEYKQVSKREFILYTIFKKIYHHLGMTRPMRVLVPVPFVRVNETNNNIGAILFVFHGNETQYEFSKTFREKKYMAAVSNGLLISKINTLLSNNINLRTQLDAIVTCIHSHYNDELYPEKGIDYALHWTTKVMPTEALYVAVYSRIKETHINTNITYTVSTTSFKKSKEMKKYEII